MFRHINGKVCAGPFECAAHEFAVIEPGYTGLPEGVIERRYDPNAPGGKPKHVLITCDHCQIAGPVPWAEGDALLSRAATYPEKLAAAFPPPTGPGLDPGSPEAMRVLREQAAAPPEPKGTTIAALRAEVAALRQALIDAGVWRA